jgi:plastocyanin
MIFTWTADGRRTGSLIAMLGFLGARIGSRLAPALGLLVALVFVACAQAGPPTPVATNQVDLPRSYRFAPESVRVPLGTTVTWTNNDNFTHSVRGLPGDAEPLLMKPGETVTHTFDSPGLFPYDCSLHPRDMKGSVLVEGGAGSS